MHRQWEDRLPFYVAGALSPDEARAVARHLEGCTHCRALVEEWRQVGAVVHAEASARAPELPALSLPVRSRAGRRPHLRWSNPFAPSPLHGAWLTITAAVTALLVILVFAWPGALTTAAEGFEAFMQRLVLGEYTTVQQVPEKATPTRHPTPAAPLVAERQGDAWIIHTAIGSFHSPGGLPGRDNDLQRFTSFVETAGALPFTLYEPGYLPAGYAFREAVVTPLYRTFLFYEGPAGDIVLLQMPVGEQPDDDPTHNLYAVVEMFTDEPLESVTVGDTPAVWVGTRGLMWEAEGINFILGGADLSRQEAIRIAESLEQAGD